MKTTKVLFLAPHLSTGGMPSFLLKRIEVLKKYYDDLEIFVVENSNYSDEYVVQKNKIIELVGSDHYWSVNDNKSLLFDIIEKNKIDLVHVDEMVEEMEKEGLNVSKLYDNNRKYRIIETCHNIWFDPKQNKRFKPDAYSFCTPWHPLKKFSEEKSQYSVIEYPIDFVDVTYMDKFKSFNKLGLDFNKKHIINVGLWTSNKNQKEVIDIARILEKTKPEYQFHFIGNQAFNFKSYWEPLMENLPSNVKIWGERNDTELFYYAADLVLFTSLVECNPLAIRESIMYGIPILSRNLEQYVNMFEGQINEIDSDIVKTSNKIIDLLDNPKKEIRKYQLNQSKIFANKHYELYDKVLKKEITLKENKLTINRNFVKQPFLEILSDPNRKFTVEFFDEKNVCHYRSTINSNMWIKLNRSYFTKWNTKIYENDELIFDESLDFTNKKVFISFDSKSLGDTIAWIPYVEEFRKKHNAITIVSTFWNHLFRDVYPNIEFVDPGSIVYNLNGMYKIGWYYDEKMEPEKPNTIPLQKTITNILGLDFKEIRPSINFQPKEKPYKKFITIATESTAQLKYWNYPNGWKELSEKLNDMGYDVVNVSLGNCNIDSVIEPQDKSIDNIMNLLYHSEFLIGLSSGLSWLNWALGKKTIMISNFTEVGHEFTSDCYRVINKNVCNSCWNNPNFIFNKGDWNWCPIFKNTPRQFECHKTITPDMVMEKVNELITMELVV